MSPRKKQNNKTISNILKGKFLVEGDAISNWKLILFFLALAFISISSSHLTDLKVVKISKLNENVQQFKARYALVHSKLMQLKVESELTPVVAKDSLYALKKHPYKILVKKQNE